MNKIMCHVHYSHLTLNENDILAQIIYFNYRVKKKESSDQDGSNETPQCVRYSFLPEPLLCSVNVKLNIF